MEGWNSSCNLGIRRNFSYFLARAPADPVGDIFVNNRKQPYSSLSWTYDNDGREINFNQNIHERVATTFDAAGRRIQVTEEDYNTTYNIWQMRWNITQGYDGDGQRIMQQENGASWPNYFIRSSVLGGAVVAELRNVNSTWLKDVFVMLGGEIIAQQKQNSPTSADEVKFMYTNPVTGAQRGAVQTEPDPLGTNQGLTLQQPNPPIYSGDSGIMDPGRYADAFNGRFLSMNGAIIPYDHGVSLLFHGYGSLESWKAGLTVGRWSRVGNRILNDDGSPSGDMEWEDKFLGFDFIDSVATPTGGCYSYYKFVYENEHVQKYINEIWEATVAEAKQAYEANRRGTGPEAREFAGAVTIDSRNYTHSFWGAKAAKPVSKNLFDISPVIENAIQQDKASGGAGRILLEIHSHVPEPIISEASGPYVDERDRPWNISWDPNHVTSPSKNASTNDHFRGASIPWVGIAVYGKGQFDIYGLNGSISKEKLKGMCVPKDSRPS